ncbi:MAG: leucine-rich repeat domain-containing protein [Candidatus Poribacteria bacterium]|nr:leucine-rich repeat domain-containing protein [Candidatus Poribacteria bacterium]
MKTMLYLTLTLLIFATLVFMPSSFAQETPPEYIVRQIYFHPSDLGPLQDIDATLDEWVEHVQQFYADEMERHGFGRKTFQLETDAQGNPVRHYVKGKFTNEHYRSNPIEKANKEISEQFDRSEHLIYLNFIKFDHNQNFSQVGGNASSSPFNGTANITLVDFDDNAPKNLYTRAWTTIAHELGHAFGLQHDFRDDRYIMSYGDSPVKNQLAYCAAEFLDAHRYFNTTRDPFSQVSTIRMLDPAFVSSPNTIRLQFEISSSAKLHQAQLLTNSLSWPGNPYFDEITVSDCKSVNGNNLTIEFVTTELAPTTEYVALHVIDAHGNFTISERFPIDITALLPESKSILIPDANLAAAIRETLDLAPGTPITELDMLGLGRLVPYNNISRKYTYGSSGRLPEKQIKDLTGLEYATNLEYLNLPYNAIDDLTPITELTKLRSIDLSNNRIQDIGSVKKLTHLAYLSLRGNQISDITPLAGLTQLTLLSIGNNPLSHTSLNTHIPALQAKGIRISYDLNLGKIIGPWLWMIAPTEPRQGGKRSINVDSLAAASAGAVTEAEVATNGAKEGDTVGDYVWKLGKIAPRGGDNINDLLNTIGMAKGDINDHSSYALITLESATAQSGVLMKVGSSDAIKVWLNGEVVHNHPIDRSASDFKDDFTVDLEKGDNLLLVKVSERARAWSMFVGIRADVNPVYKRPLDAVVSADVNGDGIVNVQDLVLVSSSLGQTGQSSADVNGDGVVNIQDLVMVAGALGHGTAASPTLHPSDLEGLTAAEVQDLLTQARQMALTDPAYLRGVAMLEQLLALLLPKETALLPNYPNPFNPETWIPYQLAKPAAVTLHIYAVDGRLVRALALGHQPVGTYQSRSRAAYWNGRNALGESVASGIYFYTLTAGDFTATRKMLIWK